MADAGAWYALTIFFYLYEDASNENLLYFTPKLNKFEKCNIAGLPRNFDNILNSKLCIDRTVQSGSGGDRVRQQDYKYKNQ